jgi:pyruvate formate lyase activating enzyme
MEQRDGLVLNIQRFSIHDGPGIRTIVFVKGCPLRCAWCHNPESQRPGPELVRWPQRCIHCGACVPACPHGAAAEDANGPGCIACGECAAVCFSRARELVGRRQTVKELVAAVERDTAFYDESGGGVTVSGGEPLMQSEFVASLLSACRERDIHTVLDTCGHAPWAAVDRVRRYVNLFLIDLKLADAKRHRQVTGVSNRRILENLSRLSELGHSIVLRMPVIPGVNDDDANVRQTAALAAALPHLEHVELLPYHGLAAGKYGRLGLPYRLPDVRPPDARQMSRIAHTLREFGLVVKE